MRNHSPILLRMFGLLRLSLTSRKQRVRLLILLSLGGAAVLLATVLVFASFSRQVPRWYKAHYSVGRVPPTAKLPARKGLHWTRTALSRNMQEDVLWIRIGSNAWGLDIMSPID
jgi:hypothetical protein